MGQHDNHPKMAVFDTEEIVGTFFAVNAAPSDLFGKAETKWSTKKHGGSSFQMMQFIVAHSLVRMILHHQ